MKGAKWWCGLGVFLSACASMPTGPSVAVMPAPGKPFEVFRQDDLVCREYARQQLGINSNEAANRQVVSGAAAGAGAGIMVGSAAGAGAASQTRMTLQQRYNIAYMQCM